MIATKKKPICFHWYIGNVDGPNLIRMVDFKPFQQVGYILLAGSGLLVFCRGYTRLVCPFPAYAEGLLCD